MFTSYILNASTGEWSKTEAPGPPDVIAWEKAFRTYRVATLLLQAIDSERIDAYIEHIKELHNRFGSECWGLMRMRGEQMERVKRDLEASPQFGYTTAAPWSAVFFASTKDSGFWSKEVIIPGTLLLAKGSSGPNRLKGPASESSDGPPIPKGSKPSKGKKRKFRGDESTYDEKEKIYTHNRKNIEICKRYNYGQVWRRPSTRQMPEQTKPPVQQVHGTTSRHEVHRRQTLKRGRGPRIRPQAIKS